MYSCPVTKCNNQNDAYKSFLTGADFASVPNNIKARRIFTHHQLVAVLYHSGLVYCCVIFISFKKPKDFLLVVCLICCTVPSNWKEPRNQVP